MFFCLNLLDETNTENKSIKIAVIFGKFKKWLVQSEINLVIIHNLCFKYSLCMPKYIGLQKIWAIFIVEYNGTNHKIFKLCRIKQLLNE